MANWTIGTSYWTCSAGSSSMLPTKTATPVCQKPWSFSANSTSTWLKRKSKTISCIRIFNSGSERPSRIKSRRSRPLMRYRPLTPLYRRSEKWRMSPTGAARASLTMMLCWTSLMTSLIARTKSENPSTSASHRQTSSHDQAIIVITKTLQRLEHLNLPR